MKIPNLFLVGAPKCGTTSMAYYLSQHPDIFFSNPKEPLFFGSDLLHSWKKRYPTIEDYMNIFLKVKNESYIAEGSVWYLFSKLAAKEIQNFNPGAKIIIMLREPTELIVSMHKQFLYSGNEHIEDINKALVLEEERRRGVHISPKAHFPAGLIYSDIPMYYRQIERYFNYFDSSQIHIIIFDDLKKNLESVYNELLSFLGVSAAYKTDFKIINKSKDHHKTRLKILKRLLNNPPDSLDNIYQFFPKKIKNVLRNKITKLNSLKVNQIGLTNSNKKELKQRFEKDIKMTEKLINRDLSDWLE